MTMWWRQCGTNSAPVSLSLVWLWCGHISRWVGTSGLDGTELWSLGVMRRYNSGEGRLVSTFCWFSFLSGWRWVGLCLVPIYSWFDRWFVCLLGGRFIFDFDSASLPMDHQVLSTRREWLLMADLLVVDYLIPGNDYLLPGALVSVVDWYFGAGNW